MESKLNENIEIIKREILSTNIPHIGITVDEAIEAKSAQIVNERIGKVGSKFQIAIEGCNPKDDYVKEYFKNTRPTGKEFFIKICEFAGIVDLTYEEYISLDPKSSKDVFSKISSASATYERERRERIITGQAKDDIKKYFHDKLLPAVRGDFDYCLWRNM